jgi:glucose/arabinose dehydrogenase/plastocyanin
MIPSSLFRRALSILGLVVFAVLLVFTAGAIQTSNAASKPMAPAAPPYPTITTEPLPPGATVVPVLPNMNLPTALAWDPAGRLFYTEKQTGNVRLFANGVLQPTEVIHFNVNPDFERGLLGIAIDPNFNTNHYIYVYYTRGDASQNVVVRFEENNGVGSNPITLFTSPQTAGNHNGGNIHFGPDGKLYITIGDNANAANSQNVTVPNGKIHRINPDGTPAPGNPVFTQTNPLPSLFAIGVRNSFDFDFDPLSTPSPWPRIYASENGPGCDDEMNRIEGGYNYGWRAGYPCDDANPSPTYNTIWPQWFLGTGGAGPCCQAPTGAHFYRGSAVPQWTNDLFMCSYNDGALRHFYLNAQRTDTLVVARVTGVTCNMDIETGPDGAFYYIQGGGYAVGTLYKILVPGAVSPTPTVPVPTATDTVPPLPTNTLPPVATNTTMPSHTPMPTDTPVPSNTPVPPTQTPGGPTATPEPPTNTATSTSTRTPYATFTATPTSVSFQDVPPGHTFYAFVTCLARQGFISGYPCGGEGEPCGPTSDPYFRPNNWVTRGQIAKIVSESAFFNEVYPNDVQTFEDVPPGSTFFQFVERLAHANVMGGYQCGIDPNEPCGPENRPYFRPDANATRGQLTKIVSNAAGFNDDLPPGTQTFTDVPTDGTFWLYIERLLLNRPGVMSGYPCGGPGEPCDSENRPYFRPNNPLTRGQTAKIVSNTFFPGCVIPVVVRIEQFAYHPDDITIPQGATVRWVNRDDVYHTATADDGGFDTGPLEDNQFGDLTFNNVGDFGYFCKPHPFMRAAIHVVPSR